MQEVEERAVLFDLQFDPNEEKNIAKEHPEIVTILRAKLDAHWKPQLATP